MTASQPVPAAAESRPFDPRLPYVPCRTLSVDDLSTMPVQFRFAQALPVTPDQLFTILEDPASWPRWAQGIGHVEWTSPPPFGVGTTRTVTFWGGIKVYEAFMAWEPGRQLAFSFYGTSEAVWTSFGEHYVVDDLGSGRCRLTWHVGYDPRGTFGRLHPWIKPIMALNLRSYLWRLARYCRRNRPAGGAS